MSARAFNAFSLIVMEFFAVEQDIRCIGNAVTAFYQHGLSSHGGGNSFRRPSISSKLSIFYWSILPLPEGSASIPAKGSNVLQSLFGFRASRRWPPVATMTGSMTTKAGRYCFNFSAMTRIVSGTPDHADFNGIDVNIFKYGINLRCNQFRCDVHIPANALCIL